MKKLLLLLSLFLPATLQAQSKIIQNPHYELSSSGIYSISKVERSKEATRLTVHCSFIPTWWIMFDEGVFIQDPQTGERFYIQELDGGIIGKRIAMPASGEYTVTMTFPPIGKDVKTIDFGEQDKELIWGISLDGKTKKQNTEIPREVIAWIEEETAKSDTPPVSDLHSPLEFFSNEKNGRLVGYIKGYDPRLGFSVGSITHNHPILGESMVSAIEIEPDGRFTSDVQLASPARPYIRINNQSLGLYLEPGQTLGVILDWENFLKLDRERNKSEALCPIAFYGPLASVNEELTEYKDRFQRKDNNITDLQEFKKYQLNNWKSQSDELGSLLQTKAVSPKTADIFTSIIINNNVLALFNQISNIKYENQNDPNIDQKIDSIKRNGYYDFMRQDFMDDPALLIDYYSYFLINRYEYAESQLDVINRLRNPKPKKSFYEYLTEELKIKTLSPEEADHFKRDIIEEYLNVKTGEQWKALTEEYNKNEKEYSKKFEREREEYNKKYTPARPSNLEIQKIWLQLKDSTMKNLFHLQPNLVQDIVKINHLKNAMNNSLHSKEEARELVNYMQFGFANPFMAAWAERLFHAKFPTGGTEDGSYELPQGKAADIFKRITDPFRGKILIVDFWATSCGPCVGAIESSKSFRESHNDNDKIAFIYITNENQSPQASYDKMVKNNGMTHSYRLSTDEWNYLSQLFQISGIPHYTLITPEGRVAEKRFHPNHNEIFMNALIEKYFSAEGD